MAQPLNTVERYHCYFIVSPSPNDAPKGIVLDGKDIPERGYFYMKIGDGDSHEAGRYRVHNPSFDLVYTANCARLLYLLNDSETDTVNPGTYLKKSIQDPARVGRSTEWIQIFYRGEDGDCGLKRLKMLFDEFSEFLSNRNNDFGYEVARNMFLVGAPRHEIAMQVTRKMKEMMEGYYSAAEGVYVNGFVDKFKSFERKL